MSYFRNVSVKIINPIVVHYSKVCIFVINVYISLHFLKPQLWLIEESAHLKIVFMYFVVPKESYKERNIIFYPQMSEMVNPVGNGSCGSTTSVLKAVINALPLIRGMTVSTLLPSFPIFGPRRTNSPSNFVPVMDSCTNGSPDKEMSLFQTLNIYLQGVQHVYLQLHYILHTLHSV